MTKILAERLLKSVSYAIIKWKIYMHHNLTKGLMQVAPYQSKLELRIKVTCMF